MNREHEILIIAKNTDGIVSRIMSLFNRRGYSVLCEIDNDSRRRRQNIKSNSKTSL